MIEQQKKDIPPGLIRIVKGSKPSKKFFILLGISLFLVIAGVGIIYFYNQYFTSEIKNQIKSTQTVTQKIPQVPVQSQKTEPEKENSNSKRENLNSYQTKESNTSEKMKSSEESQGQTKTVKIVQNKKAESKVAQKDVTLSSIDTFKGADYLYRAMDFEQKGLIHEAINEYKEYVNYSGKADPRILNKIATLYLLSGNIKEANHYAELAIQVDKNSKEILINYGVVKAKMGDLNKAEECFNRVLSIDPDNRNALFNIATLKELKGEYSEAIRFYERLYQLGDLSVATHIERLKR